jgi:para-aminobenzoate synthetase/4-amino-4-deoxychorismate lyase
MKTLSEVETAALSAWLEEQQDFVFLDTARVTSEEYRTLLFVDPVRWLICHGPEEVPSFLEKVAEIQAQGYWLAGWFSYEFGYCTEPSLLPLAEGVQGPLAVLGQFREPQDFSAVSRPVVSGDFSVSGLRTNIDRHEYLQAVSRIKEYILAGDTYQVNYTLKLLFRVHGSHSAFYRSLRRNQAVSYGAWIRQGGRDIMSFSPELFFRTDGEKVTVRPMKGTMARGRNLEEDMALRHRLQRDVKNRSENVMIVDLLRNDLGRLLHDTGGGLVRPRSLFDVEAYETLLQMTSTVDGFVSSEGGTQLVKILKALFPCGSVTGAPKIRTMEIIHELEAEPRGVYCGAIGYTGPEVSVFNVPIRTVVLEEGKGEMGIGSGIIHDSDPVAEWGESLLKGNFLTRRQPDFQLIETLLWQPGTGYWLLDEHLDRLTASAKYFLFTCSREQVKGQLAAQAHPFAGPMRVRLLLHRDGEVTVASSELDPDVRPVIEPVSGSGPHLKVAFSATPTDSENIHLFHKTTRRQFYDEERHQALEKGLYEVIFVNKNGEVTEGSISSIFITAAGGDILLTPPVACGLLAGTFRRFLLDRGRAVERVLAREDLLSADAVYVGNSVRGLVQVQIAG